ncbi:hypothetical protein GCM10029976_031630 [Kribbella albertanoniae]|uniref:M56 family peptidase n=1 Tax=Kribbella albertanoniae TaxID=1266829 RepID=A0A4R4QH21_9ACTN|nr:M56 family metallopeptidase [Kribbella albertanoniae]TDC35016.1 M56 family peptidase [Kribbella albertanoniae]
MIIAVTLFGYALLMATGGAWLLREAAWPANAPRLAIATWHALAASVLSSVLFGAAALAVRLHLVSTDLADILHICATNLRAAYATPGGAATTTLAIVVMIAVAARAVWGVTTVLRRAARQRHRHRQILELVACHDPEFDILVLEHPAPSAFCLPGRGHRIVVTSAALGLLSRSQLAAVLAHEQAHLAGRHHLLVGFSQGLALAFPGIPVFTWGHQQVRRLVELAADDQACRRHRPSSVANAILLLAGAAPPAAALALSGEATELRLLRLTSRRLPLRRAMHSTLAGVIAGVLIAPVVIAVPALVAAGMDYCGLT